MRVSHPETTPIPGPELQGAQLADAGYQPPRYELICLACEISAYAPDSDLPLF